VSAEYCLRRRDQHFAAPAEASRYERRGDSLMRLPTATNYCARPFLYNLGGPSITLAGCLSNPSYVHQDFLPFLIAFA